ncbi:MAG: hypothetical protein ABI543_07425 [Ignavibacteria bacterium]
MTFKKDYINYLLYTVVNSPGSEYAENYRLRKLVDSVIAIDDVMKITYLVGKTAGLELLFKYLLYISDKIDKSQVTIFNLKDNFEYDKINIAKICAKISKYKSENVQEAIKSITEDVKEEQDNIEIIRVKKPKDAIKIDADEDDNVTNLVEMEELDAADQEIDSDDSGMTLIENTETYTGEAEVFELDSISESVENSDKELEKASDTSEIENTDNKSEENVNGTDDDENISDEDSVLYEEETDENSINQVDNDEEAAVKESEHAEEETVTEDAIILPVIEIEVRKPMGSSRDEKHVKEEAITNEAYYTFETKFFEEVKILEKLLATVLRDCIADKQGKLSEKCLQSTTEIIGITSELSNLSRQLSFDLIADIFLTMNIYFTKSISQQEILTGERIKLLDSSLALVNSLIKGEDYLNYDTIVDKIEKLKQDISAEQKAEYVIDQSETTESDTGTIIEKKNPESAETTAGSLYGKTYENDNAEYRPEIEKPSLKKSQLETANFKLKYLIKEFEKSFAGINNLKGEYSKFDALEKIGELNNALRLIAKISAAIKNSDTLKLAEVTYVFLKYVKDYRMDMQEPEIQQIIKYIIFTFKMLLTNRKPEDFNVLVQHLNNPVKIFTDS